MLVSLNCIALIKEAEGCAQRMRDGRLKAYPDPGTGGAPWTIGWGSTGPDIRPGMVWTQAQADARLSRDVALLSAQVEDLVRGVATKQGQFDAMVCFAYNVGLANFKGSTLLKKHRAGDYVGAQAEFARWNKAAGKVLPGLTTRRAAEAALYGRA